MTELIPETPETVQKNYLNDCVPLEQLLIPKYVSIWIIRLIQRNRTSRRYI